MGGIGAFIVTLVLILGLPPIQMELPPEPALRYVFLGLAIVGYGLFAVALSAASRVTNATAGVAAIFVYLTVIGAIVSLAVLPELRGDTRQAVQVIIMSVEWVAWLMIGIWGLTAGSTLGVLGYLGGVFGLLGGIAGITFVVVGFATSGSAWGVMMIAVYVSYIGAAVAALLFGTRLVGGITKNA